jgi:two-component system OmpR family response regulator/two-component system response regulator CpxR
MPRINGLDVLQQLRQSIQTPVIMVTGRGDDIDKILGLELGADDYLAKPCNPRELLARINAILRRSFIQESALHSVDPSEKVTPQLTVGMVTINRARREAKVAGQTLQLTSVEFSVLLHLMDAAGTVVSKDEISRKVLHRELSAYDRSIDVHVSRIRKKIEALQQQPSAIKTLRGQGYLFADETQ